MTNLRRKNLDFRNITSNLSECICQCQGSRTLPSGMKMNGQEVQFMISGRQRVSLILVNCNLMGCRSSISSMHAFSVVLIDDLVLVDTFMAFTASLIQTTSVWLLGYNLG